MFGGPFFSPSLTINCFSCGPNECQNKRRGFYAYPSAPQRLQKILGASTMGSGCATMQWNQSAALYGCTTSSDLFNNNAQSVEGSMRQHKPDPNISYAPGDTFSKVWKPCRGAHLADLRTVGSVCIGRLHRGQRSWLTCSILILKFLLIPPADDPQG